MAPDRPSGVAPWPHVPKAPSFKRPKFPGPLIFNRSISALPILLEHRILVWKVAHRRHIHLGGRLVHNAAYEQVRSLDGCAAGHQPTRSGGQMLEFIECRRQAILAAAR